VLAELGDHFA